jgi:inosose dehydratase
MSGTNRITRRRFAVGVLSGAVGLHAAAALSAEKKARRYQGVSCQTYVWSQVLGAQKKKLGDCLDQVFGEIRSGGYGGVETMADFLDKPDLADLLAKHRLRLTGVYSGGALHDREKAKPVLARLTGLGPRIKKLGCDVLVVNPDPIGREKTDAELATQTAMLTELGRELHESGVELNVHTHAPEMRSNGREFRSNLDNTDPSLVGLCADVDWIRRGGGDPYQLLTRYADRIGCCHLRNSVNGVWSESLGDGDIDYRRIAKIFADIRKRIYLTVELAYEQKTQRTRALAEDAALSRKYVRAVFGV